MTFKHLFLFGHVLSIFIASTGTFACDLFVEIDEANYDRDYASIHETTKRPLGFQRDTVTYNNPDTGDPCFEVQGTEGRQVEIMFETVPSTVLCFRDQDGVEVCDDGRHETCKFASSDTTQLTFFCDVAHGCAEAEVNFWMRIVVGPPPEQDTEGMWCMERNSQYPEDLAPLPPSYTPKPTNPPMENDGCKLTSKIGLLLMIGLVAAYQYN